MLKHSVPNPLKKGTDTQVEIKELTVVHFNLLVDFNPYFGISPRNLTLFTRPFLARKCPWVGHQTSVNPTVNQLSMTQYTLPQQ